MANSRFIEADDILIRANDIRNIDCDPDKCTILFGTNDFRPMTSVCSKIKNPTSYNDLITGNYLKYQDNTRERNHTQEKNDVYHNAENFVPKNSQIEKVYCHAGKCEILYYKSGIFGPRLRKKRVKENTLRGRDNKKAY